MPTYEYKCNKCGKIFEKFQSMKDEPLKRCILGDCDGDVQRLISKGGGIIFKGAGFYETDYRSSSYKESEKKESGNSEKCSTCSSSSDCSSAD